MNNTQTKPNCLLAAIVYIHRSHQPTKIEGRNQSIMQYWWFLTFKKNSKNIVSKKRESNAEVRAL